MKVRVSARVGVVCAVAALVVTACNQRIDVGVDASEATGISPNGWIVGIAHTGATTPPPAFVRSPDGQVHRVAPHGGVAPDVHLQLTAVNDQGTAVGVQYNGGSPRAVRWTPAGGLEPVGAPGANGAVDTNSAGTIAGWVDRRELSGTVRVPVRWAADGTMTELTNPGTTTTDVLAINDPGDVLTLGYATVALWPAAGGTPRTMWFASVQRDLGGDVNRRGDVVVSTEERGTLRATVWAAGGQPVRLAGGTDGPTAAAAVTEAGGVVGYAWVGGQRRVAYWEPGTYRYHDLGVLDGDEAVAIDANERTIVGHVFDHLDDGRKIPHLAQFDIPAP